MMKVFYLNLQMIVLLVVLIHQCSSAQGWGYDERVKLKDVETLTLYAGRMSTSRRGAPVPQLNCIGGCHLFQPQVVQCYNRGFDGRDINWECKADMDNEYRFGRVEVTCEGYDHPGDKYILAGSCGLDYTIEPTKAGRSEQSYYERSYSGDTSPKVNVVGDFIFYVVIAIIVYIIYKSCVGSTDTRRQYSSTNEDYPGYPPTGGAPPRDSPPTYGFRPEYGSGGDGDSCGGAQRRENPYGFWTGAGLGGLFGYLMGNRNQYGYQGNYYQRNRGYSWGPSFGGGSSSTSSSSRSSGTRTASGFGTTRVR